MSTLSILKSGRIGRLSIMAAVTLVATACGKAGTDTVESSINISTDAYWVAFKDGKKGQWSVLANGYTTSSKREVRSFSFRVESEDGKFTAILACPASIDEIAPHTLDVYYAHTGDVSFISRICAPDKTPDATIVTGIVQNNALQIYPILGKQRSIFAGGWTEQIEDFRAFSAWSQQLKRFDIIAALATITEDGGLDIDRFFIQRDNSITAEAATLFIDFGSPQFSFAPDKSGPKPVFTGALGSDTDLQANESMHIGVDFVSEHGQIFHLAANSRDPAATALSPLPYIGVPNKRASRDNPATQLPGEGHRVYAQIRDNTRQIGGSPPIVRSAISMFRTPRDAIAVIPNADRATMSFTRPDNDPRNILFSWKTANDPLYGAAQMWHLTGQEHIAGNTNQVRLAVNAFVTRAWLSDADPDLIENFSMVPFDDLAKLRGWFDGWQFAASRPISVSARSVFMTRSATQAALDAIMHSTTTDGASYGDIRSYGER